MEMISLNENIILVISPTGNYYKRNIDGSGHGIKLIKYFELNNLDFDKEKSIFYTSQEFAFTLANMGYIVFFTESGLSSIFLTDDNVFTENQIISIIEHKDEIRKILENKIISFNLELRQDLENSYDNFDTFINYINDRISITHKR